MEERILIERAQVGNKSALNTLLTNNLQILKGYTIKMTGDPHLAQDILQDTLLKAVLNIHKFQQKGKFSTWLITIATNVYRDYLRKNKRDIPLEENIMDIKDNLEDKVMIKLEYQMIMDLLMQIPLEKRAIFILKHYHGYKYREIAEIFHCPVGTVRSRLHYTVKYVMKELEKREML